jgi:hypothetical protein
MTAGHACVLETATISGIGTRAKELEGVVIQQKSNWTFV